MNVKQCESCDETVEEDELMCQQCQCDAMMSEIEREYYMGYWDDDE